jgi:branched-subunit amino acid transport protein AzlD
MGILEILFKYCLKQIMIIIFSHNLIKFGAAGAVAALLHGSGPVALHLVYSFYH